MAESGCISARNSNKENAPLHAEELMEGNGMEWNEVEWNGERARDTKMEPAHLADAIKLIYEEVRVVWAQVEKIDESQGGYQIYEHRDELGGLRELRQQIGELEDEAMNLWLALPKKRDYANIEELEEFQARFLVAEDYLENLGRWLAFLPKETELRHLGNNPLDLLMQMCEFNVAAGPYAFVFEDELDEPPYTPMNAQVEESSSLEDYCDTLRHILKVGKPQGSSVAPYVFEKGPRVPHADSRKMRNPAEDALLDFVIMQLASQTGGYSKP